MRWRLRLLVALGACALAGGVASCSKSYGSEEPPAAAEAGDGGVADTSPGDAAEAVRDGSVPDGDANGPAFVTLATIDDPGQIAIDSTHVYYTSLRGLEIRRCPRTGCGSGKPELVVSGLSVPSGLALSGTTLYWASGYRFLMKCALDGALPCSPAMFVDQGVNSYPAYPSPFGTRLYWVNESGSTHRILTCPLTGCSSGYPKSIYVSAPGDPLHGQPVVGVVLDGTYAYLPRFDGGIVRLNMIDDETIAPGSGVVIAPTPYTTNNLELDGTTLRWSVGDTGAIAACTSPSCTSVTNLLADRMHPLGTRSDVTYVFGIDQGPLADGGGAAPNAGVLWRLRK
jgi:hypothetical protein